VAEEKSILALLQLYQITNAARLGHRFIRWLRDRRTQQRVGGKLVMLRRHGVARRPSRCASERRNHRTLLELLVHTAEQYQQELKSDRELFQVIALDAKGVAQSRITASRASRLLEESAQIANETPAPAKTAERKRATAKVSATVNTDAQQPIAVQH
jgi:hypothetical protein